mgnify:CR=1 FL=1
MDKRGQFYLLAAIIIAFAIFVILSPSNTIKETTTTTNFEEIATNFEKESARFLNHLFEDASQHIGDEFLNFTVLFTSYAKTKNKDFGLIYAFAHEEKLYLGNYDATSIDVFLDNNPVASLDGCANKINAQAVVLGLNIAISDIERSTYMRCIAEVSIPAGIVPPYPLTVHIHENNSTTPLTTTLEPSHPDLIIVAREAAGNIRRVYIKGHLEESP